MDSYMLLGFVEILRESLKILFKSRRLMSYVATLTLLNSPLFLSNIFSIKALLGTFLATTSPNSSSEFTNLLVSIKKDGRILILVQSIFLLACSIVSLFSTMATIIVSAITFCNIKYLSFKDLLSWVGRSCILKPFITWFYVTLFGWGYTFFVLAILNPLLMFVEHPVDSKAFFIVIVAVIPALISYLYLSVVCALTLVILVVEESCSGIEALGKAGRLVKGKRLHGFVLNFIFMLLYAIVFQGFRIPKVRRSLTTQQLSGCL